MLPGLSREEAARRLAADGPNRLPPPPAPSPLREFFGQLVHFFAVMLWTAAVLAVLADLVALAVAIALVIVINAVFSFIQERRADESAARLRDLLPQRILVRRDSTTIEVAASDIVCGDVLVLAAGDRIPADATVDTPRGLRVDTSLLTGESAAVAVVDGETILAGTFVVDGETDAVVTHTGRHTRLAAIAQLTAGTRKPTSPLTKELHRVVRTIAVIAVGLGVSFMLISLLIGTDFGDATVFAIGVTVALVPEGLLPTVTLSLSIGAQRMAKRNALVRHLDAVETLGSTTFICTDKTGTLTSNEMAVVEVWMPSGSAMVSGDGYEPTATISSAVDPAALAALGRAGARCSTGRIVHDGDRWKPRGDPMEAALDAFARRTGVDMEADRGATPDRWRLPFDSVRKRMTAALDDGTLFVKGAVESVLPSATQPPGRTRRHNGSRTGV